MDETSPYKLQRWMLTMKITYERLNQIIEEEVDNFKKLNEQMGIGGGVQASPGSLDAIKIKAKKAIDAATSVDQLVKAAQDAVKGS